MKMETVSLALFAAAFYGCGSASSPTTPAPQPVTGIEVDAPGVHVEVGGGKGVEVERPGLMWKCRRNSRGTGLATDSFLVG